ncbi:MAG: hypothetical protein GY853_01660 [PVC group bacterium]|nr:hypothetical protein [PVC group bacterium]
MTEWEKEIEKQLDDETNIFHHERKILLRIIKQEIKKFGDELVDKSTKSGWLDSLIKAIYKKRGIK